MAEKFAGFPRDAFRFFRELTRNNSKAWFDRNRERYQQSIVTPFRALLVALTPFILRLDPAFEVAGKTNRNFSRINRDIRFHRDRAPYHTNYYLYFFDRTRNRMDAGRLYVGLSADGLTVGFSIYGDRGSVLEQVTKARVGADEAALARYLGKLGRLYGSYWYKMEKGEWTKVPGYPRSAEDWERLKGWVVRRLFAASEIKGPTVLRRIQKIFKELYPLYTLSANARMNWKGLPRR